MSVGLVVLLMGASVGWQGPPAALRAPSAPRSAARPRAAVPMAAPAPAARGGDQAWNLWLALPIFPFRTRKTVRTEVVRGQVWTFDQLQGTLYVHVPIRMTVVKYADRETSRDALLAYCPVAPTRECIRLVRELEAEHGPVRHVVLPTLGVEHKVFAGPFTRAVGRPARLWFLPGQYSFPVDLPLDWVGFAGTRSTALPASSAGLPWEGQIEHEILGTFRSRDGAFGEAAFLHKPSKTLLVTDMIVCVRSQHPAIMEYDVDAMLYHARDTGFESVADSPAVRTRGWERIALFALFFNPAGIRVKSLREAFTDNSRTPADMKRLGWLGLYPWDWDPASAERSFAAIKDRPFVPPVLSELILDRQPEATVAFAQRVARWNFDKIIPAHLNAPVRASPADWLRAWFFLQDKAIDVEPLLPPPLRRAQPTDGDLKLLRGVSDSLVASKVVEPKAQKIGSLF